MMDYFSHGKRGEIFLEKRGKHAIVVKRRNPRSAVDTIANEARYTKILNSRSIGPRFISFRNGELRREYVEGKPLKEWLPKATPEATLRVLKEILQQCRTMDQLKITKHELTRPWKDIIITNGSRPVLIDFERCTNQGAPKNVTQFCQFLTSTNITRIMQEKVTQLNKKKIRELAREYKQELRENNQKRESVIFRKIVAELENASRANTTPFQERVYNKLKLVPPGKVTTYGDLARQLKTSPRAVGQALRNNPHAPRVPCHRVVKSNGAIGGYRGDNSNHSLRKKRALLKEEGVRVEHERVSKFEQVKYQWRG